MKLVDAYAIEELLRDNVDANVEAFVVFTVHGTLLAHSQRISVQDHLALTKFAPFAGLEWRRRLARNMDEKKGLGEANTAPKLLKLQHANDAPNSEIKSMTLHLDGIISVVRTIVPGLLLAAQIAEDRIKDGETSPMSAGPSKSRILELKAEGMAECLAEEYPAELPHDFF